MVSGSIFNQLQATVTGYVSCALGCQSIDTQQFVLIGNLCSVIIYAVQINLIVSRSFTLAHRTDGDNSAIVQNTQCAVLCADGYAISILGFDSNALSVDIATCLACFGGPLQISVSIDIQIAGYNVLQSERAIFALFDVDAKVLFFIIRIGDSSVGIQYTGNLIQFNSMLQRTNATLATVQRQVVTRKHCTVGGSEPLSGHQLDILGGSNGAVDVERATVDAGKIYIIRSLYIDLTFLRVVEVNQNRLLHSYGYAAILIPGEVTCFSLRENPHVFQLAQLILCNINICSIHAHAATGLKGDVVALDVGSVAQNNLTGFTVKYTVLDCIQQLVSTPAITVIYVSLSIFYNGLLCALAHACISILGEEYAGGCLVLSLSLCLLGGVCACCLHLVLVGLGNTVESVGCVNVLVELSLVYAGAIILAGQVSQLGLNVFHNLCFSLGSAVSTFAVCITIADQTHFTPVFQLILGIGQGVVVYNIHKAALGFQSNVAVCAFNHADIEVGVFTLGMVNLDIACCFNAQAIRSSTVIINFGARCDTHIYRALAVQNYTLANNFFCAVAAIVVSWGSDIACSRHSKGTVERTSSAVNSTA